MIAKIAVSAAPFAIDKPYSYRIPKDLRLVPGVRVMVPFGKGNRRSEGVVLSVEEGNEDELKAVEQCLDEDEFLNVKKMPLARLVELCLDGTVADAKTVCGALKAQAFLAAGKKPCPLTGEGV